MRLDIKAIKMNGARHPKDGMLLARNKLKGTPATVDTENADITVPKALPLRSNGIESAMMV